MKTELEKLEENAKKEYVIQRCEALRDEMKLTLRKRSEMKRWQIRTVRLNFLGIFVYWVAVVCAFFAQLPDSILNFIQIYWILLFFVLIIREHYFERRFEYFDGVSDGIVVALEILYPDITSTLEGDEPKKVKKTSMFKRFKEFFERVGQGNTKEVPA